MGARNSRWKGRAMALGAGFALAAAAACLNLDALTGPPGPTPSGFDTSTPDATRDETGGGTDGSLTDGTGPLDGGQDATTLDQRWRVYSRSPDAMAPGVWDDESIPADEFWTPGVINTSIPNAPPATGISSVCQFSSFDRILVIDAHSYY